LPWGNISAVLPRMPESWNKFNNSIGQEISTS